MVSSTHEFGHVFGLRHPQPKSLAELFLLPSYHIPGTEELNPDDFFDYESVMHSGPCPGTFNYTKMLSEDDKRSIEFLYGPP